MQTTMSEPTSADSTSRLCPRCGYLVTIGHNGNLLMHVCWHDVSCSCFDQTHCDKCKTEKAPPGTHAPPPGMTRGQKSEPAFVPGFGSQPRQEQPRHNEPRPAETPDQSARTSQPPKATGSKEFQPSLFGEPAPEPTPAPSPAPKAVPGTRTGLPKKARHVAGSDTSRGAAESLSEGVLNDMQLKVLETIIVCKGMTCDEVELHLGMRHTTVSARINELTRAGYIEDSGERRNTSAGRPATVWKATSKATS